MRHKAVFLDRDGTINADRDDYVKSIAELEVFPYAGESVRILNEAGLEVYVISNQQCIGKGVMAEEDLLTIEREVERQVEAGGGKISGFYYCKHLASENCACRKPEPGLILQAASEHDIDLVNSFMVGDSERDSLAGKAAGCKTVLVLTGMITRAEAETGASHPDFVAENLREAVGYIVNGLKVLGRFPSQP